MEGDKVMTNGPPVNTVVTILRKCESAEMHEPGHRDLGELSGRPLPPRFTRVHLFAVSLTPAGKLKLAGSGARRLERLWTNWVNIRN